MLSALLSFSMLFNLGQLHQAGYRGEGMTIAVIDGGFFRVNEDPAFKQDHIIDYYDLVKEDYMNGDTSIVDTVDMFDNAIDYHGAMVLSTMLYQDEHFCGTAPDAHFILIRSEEHTLERRAEVERLARAVKLADSLDVDIITISLGYRTFDDPSTNFTYNDMNGTSIVADAVTTAARHNRIVCISAGNDANNDWHYIHTPADAYDVLTVGAARMDSVVAGQSFYSPASFSSFGPSADGRQKPEVSALGQGTVVLNPTYRDSTGVYYSRLASANGTSFSCPEIAGMAACLWQALPQLSATDIRHLIIESSHLYNNPDPQLGYGIPDAYLAYQQGLEQIGGSALATHQADKQTLDSQNSTLIFRDGQLFILRAEQIYTILGQRAQ